MYFILSSKVRITSHFSFSMSLEKANSLTLFSKMPSTNTAG
nr:MAG TPA: hypothetical protein [Caudoviricetes sp.]